MIAGPTATLSPPLRPSARRVTVVPVVEREVTLNRPVEGVYVPGQTRELYVFHSDRAGRVGVILITTDEGGPLRLQALLYDANRQIMPRASAPVGQPLLRDEWNLPGPGDYTVQVFGPEVRMRTFTLTVVSRPMPESGGGTLGYGESRSGEIAVRGQRDRWVFRGQAGDHVRLTMTAPEADAYLELYDSAGHLIAHNDDGSPSTRDPVLDLVIPADGEYIVVARMYGDDQTGAYRLSLEQMR
ncbi:MAG TPA: PPC domain-containing protein [Aggregatilineaceae bacterium]|nr:PPC domain-containing protein [Aggregatilineaceae bacterium]